MGLLFASQAKADMVIEYYEAGDNLVFDWSGSLNMTATNIQLSPLLGIGPQLGTNPIFYSAPTGYGSPTTVSYSSLTAANFNSLPYKLNSGLVAEGDSFMFRINPGSGNINVWFAPNYNGGLVSGKLTVLNESIQSAQVVDWSVTANGLGSISIQGAQLPSGGQNAQTANVSVPATAMLFGLGLMFLGQRRKRM